MAIFLPTSYSNIQQYWFCIRGMLLRFFFPSFQHSLVCDHSLASVYLWEQSKQGIYFDKITESEEKNLNTCKEQAHANWNCFRVSTHPQWSNRSRSYLMIAKTFPKWFHFFFYFVESLWIFRCGLQMKILNCIYILFHFMILNFCCFWNHQHFFLHSTNLIILLSWNVIKAKVTSQY